MSAAFDRFARRRAHLDVDNPLRSLTDVINRVEGGINLGQGVCDLDNPLPLQRGAIESIDGGDRQLYTHYSGLPELREAIAKKLRAFNGLAVEGDQVVVAAGSSAAFFAAALAVLDPGDEVVLFEPFYSYHYTQLELIGAVPVCVRLSGADYGLDAAALRAAITPRTRGILINTPANPTGKMFDRADLAAVADAVEGTDIVVFTDEVYEYMCFDGRRHLSPASFERLADRTLTIGGFSKTFSITGWRIGYLAGPREVVEMTGRVFDQMNVCAARPLQRGVERALRELPASFYSDLQGSYERKRNAFCDALEAGGFGITRPQGAYYVMANYEPVFGDLEPYDAVMKMIETVRINGVPGHLFYGDPAGVREIRFQFAVTPEVLDEACSRLASLGESGVIHPA